MQCSSTLRSTFDQPVQPAVGTKISEVKISEIFFLALTSAAYDCAPWLDCSRSKMECCLHLLAARVCPHLLTSSPPAPHNLGTLSALTKATLHRSRSSRPYLCCFPLVSSISSNRSAALALCIWHCFPLTATLCLCDASHNPHQHIHNISAPSLPTSHKSYLMTSELSSAIVSPFHPLISSQPLYHYSNPLPHLHSHTSALDHTFSSLLVLI
jgi:hypothetical protein